MVTLLEAQPSSVRSKKIENEKLDFLTKKQASHFIRKSKGTRARRQFHTRKNSKGIE